MGKSGNAYKRESVYAETVKINPASCINPAFWMSGLEDVVMRSAVLTP